MSEEAQSNHIPGYNHYSVPNTMLSKCKMFDIQEYEHYKHIINHMVVIILLLNTILSYYKVY